MEFKPFSTAIKAQFDIMAKGELYVVNLDSNFVFEKYLDFFPEGTNEIHKERREYDCQCCRQFIRNIGNVVSIVNGKVVTVWDILIASDVFQEVTDKMHELVSNAPIEELFIHSESHFGQDLTHQQLADGRVINWNHFHCVVPSKFVNDNHKAIVGRTKTDMQVFARGIQEISMEAIDITLDLISDGLYKGPEFVESVANFKVLKAECLTGRYGNRTDVFFWSHFKTLGARVRNTSIGTLLQDLSEGKDVTNAVNSFESKVSAGSYKRSSAIATPMMKKKMLEKITADGLEPSLYRRFATIEDINVNDVLFADRDASALMKDSLESLLMGGSATSSNAKVFKNISEMSIADFVRDVLPNTESMEVLVEGKHISNLVSLITAKDDAAKNLFQWDNTFSWGYNGEITDSSIKQRVKIAGGATEGVLRISLGWFNTDDLDIHIHEPKGGHIYHGNARRRHASSGVLDVDMNVSRTVRDAVENVSYSDLSKMPVGDYEIRVNNYTKRENVDNGCTIEIEYAGQLHTLSYNADIRGNCTVAIATVHFDGANFTLKNINKAVTASGVSKDVWGIKTQEFQKVSSMMLSPNFWDSQEVGNKHFFFMLEDCVNPDETRGFYNEFLKSDLTEHRKGFEMLADMLKCEATDNQLSGLGFSSTQRNELVVKVKGNFTRTLKIKF